MSAADLSAREMLHMLGGTAIAWAVFDFCLVISDLLEHVQGPIRRRGCAAALPA